MVFPEQSDDVLEAEHNISKTTDQHLSELSEPSEVRTAQSVHSRIPPTLSEYISTFSNEIGGLEKEIHVDSDENKKQ